MGCFAIWRLQKYCISLSLYSDSDMMVTSFKRLVTLLRSPYPELRQRWKTVVLPSLLVFFILYVLQPFGISKMGENKLPVLAGYAVVSSAMLAVSVYVLPALFPAWYREERWTVGKEMIATLLLCVLITLGNWCYTAAVFGLELDMRLLGICLMWMVVIGPFPIVLFVMWNRNLQLRRNLEEAVEMNVRFGERMRAEAASACVPAEAGAEVRLESGIRESLALDPVRLLYAESEGNYVRLNYLAAGSDQPKVKLLRLTMKQAEEAFSDYPYIIRCHRAYLVNLHRVAKVTGNAQGYRLYLEGCGAEVPVSRSYAAGVKRGLAGIR